VAHLQTKLRNISEVMKRFNSGKGPDVLALVEIEADQTPEGAITAEAFRMKYASVTLQKMLTEPLEDEVKTLPAELLLLKAFEEAGLMGYDVASGEPEFKNGRAESAVKVVLFSRIPIQHEKTKTHSIKDARPILEVWLKHQKHELAVFVNHWKSGSGDPKMEAIRVENAKVLRARIDEIARTQPAADIILAGDFNSDYNQASRYGFAETGINTVLRAVGDEAEVQKKGAAALYNLWYELPPSERKSDAYRDSWGTLMHIIINGRLYDNCGFQYVDGSFRVGRFEDLNVLSWSGLPKRWSFAGNGSGFSDHFPLEARFRYVASSDTAGKIALVNPSVTDDATAGVNKIIYKVPSGKDVFQTAVLADASKRSDFVYEMFEVKAAVSEKMEVVLDGETYGLYSPAFDLKTYLADVAGKQIKVTFYGRLTQFRGKWQFTIDDPVLIVR
jgi:endonuclease/exonuclease/phosphatase family metal-dependent hydrolase